MSNPRPSEKRTPAAFHTTDLLAYATDVKAFEAYLREHVRCKEDVERLLREFDEEQKRHWAEHLIDDKGD
jgi:hypothetical protein